MPDSQEEAVIRKKARRFGLLLLVVALGIAAFGIHRRAQATRDLRSAAVEATEPVVSVAVPKPAQAAGALLLPGNLEALNSAAIYAQTSGYVREWLVDIGDHVQKGQVLAVLDAPELDHQLAQARADYVTATTEQKTAQSLADRARKLLKAQAISQEGVDTRTGDAAAKAAAAEAALANVRRLEAQQGFTRLTAPFDGTVTSRSAQIGDLVVSGIAGAKPLFTIADASRVRVYVRVPQNNAPDIRPGVTATLSLPDHPDKTFEATVTRSAGAVDVASGSVLVELQADNKDGALLPGSYVQAAFASGAAAPGRLEVPGSALLYRDDKPALIIIGADNRATIRTVEIGRDKGKTVEISAGLQAGERVVETPPDAIQDGDLVRIKADAPTAKP